MTTVCRF